MRLKDDSVKIQGITNELLFALMVADGLWREYDEELVITSLNDGKHSLTSLHYSGNAADLRINYFDVSERENASRILKSRLGIDYDVVLEIDHIHLEYQPRRR